VKYEFGLLFLAEQLLAACSEKILSDLRRGGNLERARSRL
jgi:hypothetical protein